MIIRRIDWWIPRQIRQDSTEDQRKLAKRMAAQANRHTFDPFELISVVGFLKHFLLACNTNGIHKEAAM